MHVVSNDGRLLFSGSRHDCKQFIRKNNVKQYKLKERFVEKVVVTQPTAQLSPTLDNDSLEPERFFNKIFEVNE